VPQTTLKQGGALSFLFYVSRLVMMDVLVIIQWHTSHELGIDNGTRRQHMMHVLLLHLFIRDRAPRESATHCSVLQCVAVCCSVCVQCVDE